MGQVLQTGFDVNSPVGANQSVQVAIGQSVTGVDFANQINGITGQSAPVITSIPPLSAKVGNQYQYQVTASDADGDTLGFTLLSGPPERFSIRAPVCFSGLRLLTNSKEPA